MFAKKRKVKLMAFETNLVAIRWLKGEYDVVSSITAEINLDALRSKQQLVDVSTDLSYSDYATVVSFDDFPKYLLPESTSGGSTARDWYKALFKEVSFILVHETEWESGL
jgi:hypothetical protein